MNYFTSETEQRIYSTLIQNVEVNSENYKIISFDNYV